ncbi:MAG: hypothetical protein ACE37F_30885 [Nannocystaceae bacterium]|nr:hypothetical protein [bacterium]
MRIHPNDARASRRVGPDTTVQMSATLVLRHLDAFRAEVGSNTVDRALASLPEAVRDEVDALVPGAWLDCPRIDDIYDAIALEAGDSVEGLLPAVAERGTHDAFSSVWRALLRMAPGRLVVKRAASLFEKSYTHGVLSAVNSPEGMTLELTHWPGVPRNRLLGIAAGSRAALRLAGKFEASIDFQTSPDGAYFFVKL